MFRAIRTKINEIDRSATEALLMSNRRGVLAMNGDNGGSLSNVGVFTLRAFFGTNHMYGWCHFFAQK